MEEERERGSLEREREHTHNTYTHTAHNTHITHTPHTPYTLHTPRRRATGTERERDTEPHTQQDRERGREMEVEMDDRERDRGRARRKWRETETWRRERQTRVRQTADTEDRVTGKLRLRDLGTGGRGRWGKSVGEEAPGCVSRVGWRGCCGQVGRREGGWGPRPTCWEFSPAESPGLTVQWGINGITGLSRGHDWVPGWE